MFEGLEVVSNALCLVGESPVWDQARKCLWMVDVQGRRLRCILYANGRARDTVLPQQIGAVVLSRNGRLIGCMEEGLYLLTPEGEAMPLLAPIMLDGPRFNDVKAGPDGCLYGGTIHYQGKGAFYRITPTLQKTTLLRDIGNANGVDWDEARGLMYFHDTPTMRTDAYVFNAATGTLGQRRCVRRYTAAEGNPDGLTLDSQGNLWVALWGHGRVMCLSPDTGAVLREIRLPVHNVTSCTFAGEDLRDLVITTAAHGTVLREEPLAGAVFRIRTETPGRLPNRFNDQEGWICD